MGGRGNSGVQRSAPTKTRTERMVGLITDEIEEWIADSYMDDDDKSMVHNWHDLLEQLGMTSAEAKESITDALWDRAGTWRWYDKPKVSEEDQKLIFMDNEFEDENGNYLKYGDVMKLVKAELKNRGIFK